MDSYLWVLPAIITICYLKFLGIGVHWVNKKKYKIEKRALLICTFVILISTFVLFVPIDSGIHISFALAGITVAVSLVILLVWIRLTKKFNQQIYEKSVGVLEKFLGRLV